MSTAGKVVQKGATALRHVTPVQSISKDQARQSVLQVYKDLRGLKPHVDTVGADGGYPSAASKSTRRDRAARANPLRDIKLWDFLDSQFATAATILS
ncbi:hypothetical protein Y032_0164g3544 [Ancylostoma ceylanicum]|uniref:Uncharacterized protein n=1 Tax=Ancylostoma ceylanicum TaxID=53326 RepID=A0A016SX86_9BILA|nr:hypothetical protein Y032_0164g3544 [Ancylostoma ceylanicum]